MNPLQRAEAATVVDRYLAAIEAATIGSVEVFSEHVHFDATVPNWRYELAGSAAVVAELEGWFADPGQFEEVRRTPLPTGELVTFTLTWHENGVPYACHQAHELTVEGNRITDDRAWCGGRWSASLLAEMSAAAHVHH